MERLVFTAKSLLIEEGRQLQIRNESENENQKLTWNVWWPDEEFGEVINISPNPVQWEEEI